MIFGDLEPDSVSLSPRNKAVWAEAAPKIARGHLNGVLIECSYDDSQPRERLFGHLAPRYLIEELIALAEEIRLHLCNNKEKNVESKKRKRASVGGVRDSSVTRRYSPRRSNIEMSSQDLVSPLTATASASFGTFSARELRNTNLIKPLEDPSPYPSPYPEDATNLCSTGRDDVVDPITQLKGMKIVIIHVKDRLEDGPEVGEIIEQELREGAEREGLLCDFVVAKTGGSVWL